MTDANDQPPRKKRPLWHLPGLYWRTLPNLRKGQISGRISRLCKMRWAWLRGVPQPSLKRGFLTLPKPFVYGGTEISEQANAWMEGRYELLNLPALQSPMPPWRNVKERGLLWQFHLHAFGYARELAQAYSTSGKTVYAERIIALMLDWLVKNPPARGPGWHPHPLSKRIVAWLQILGAVQDTLPARSAMPRLIAALAQQVVHLINTLETDLAGNHYLSNLLALTWADACLSPFLPTPLSSQLRVFSEQYWTQFLRQTRPDGSHEENSPSYTVGVCQDAFETLVMTERAGRVIPEEAQERLIAVFSHLMQLLRPDGQLPLLNDTLQNEPLPAQELLAAGATYFQRPDWKYVIKNVNLAYTCWLFGREGVNSFHELAIHPLVTLEPNPPACGYCVIRSGWGPLDDYFLLDCGALGPQHQMGHGHADSLNVEIFSHGQSIVCDPGVYHYMPGPWRDHFRSTAAHNTVEVDGLDSSEVWASFRVAKAANAACQQWLPGKLAGGYHDGYVRLKDPVRHQRRVERQGTGQFLVHDTLESGGASHQYAWRFQLAPNVKAVACQGLVARIELPNNIVAHFHFSGPEALRLTLDSGWVASGWNQKTQAPALKLTLQTAERSVGVQTHVLVERERT